ncbi:M60 family metallopeptidase [Arcticibacter eurypsychrophilus]|uniref:M60 family metallopeptidase n=1 Tax=Arcticibacter eurypsychrophilus TaxID=1434752 RepID=UPI00084DCC3C|nr:M60 family metallopeptidase [Arcticibacter eurypsychrophilus]
MLAILSYLVFQTTQKYNYLLKKVFVLIKEDFSFSHQSKYISYMYNITRLIHLIIVIVWLCCSGCYQTRNRFTVSPQTPVEATDKVLREKLSAQSKKRLSANVIYESNPSSKNFPGMVRPSYSMTNNRFHFRHIKPDSADFILHEKMGYSDPEKFTLYCTGLYAVPGKPFYVTFSSKIFSTNDVAVVIGAHSDYLADYSDQDWRRLPAVTSYFVINDELKFASSPYGGLIYLAIKSNAPTIDAFLFFKNVVYAPYFKSGETDIGDWCKQLSNNKAPWGEIASDKVSITLPDSALQKIDDPQKILNLWDRIISTAYELAQIKAPLCRPVRFVVDEQISDGFMHAGYPIMLEHSVVNRTNCLDFLIDSNRLLTPSDGGANWGFFHELGHNLQNTEWVFEGTTEVTCNLFTLYVFDKVFKSRERAHPDIQSGHQRLLMNAYFEVGASYERYKKQDPFLALIPFMQLQEEFGWEPFKKVFKIYNDIQTDDTLHNLYTQKDKFNLYKIDRFIERLSVATNKNLVPFFRTWGIPGSQQLAKKLGHLNDWIPQELKPYIKER